MPQSGHRLKRLLLAVLVLLVAIPANVHGHGNASETVGPVDINGKSVSLEISSSATDPGLAADQQISISLLNHDTKVTLRDVTFKILAERGDEFLFDRQFDAEHGFVVFNFVSGEDPVTIAEEEGSEFFASLLGFDSRLVHIRGSDLAEGGLYKFKVTVLAAEGLPLGTPEVFSAGVSIPQTTRHHINDPNYGSQYIDVITYYDAISDFAYDPLSREITYSMPFEWSEENINQTLVVHEEISIPLGFGDLLASGFTMHVNGIKLSEKVVAVDDFIADGRTVHFTIFQQELLKLLEDAGDGMSFAIRPDRDYIHLSAVTDNGQFRIYAHSPDGLESGQDARITFDVTDVFLRDVPVAASYELSVSQAGRTIHEQSGTSTDSKTQHNTAEFSMPADVTGIVHLNLKLDGNDRATAAISMVVDRASPVPDHIRSGALAWSQDKADDDAFLQITRQLVDSGHIRADADIAHAPSWLKYAAGAWASGDISDSEFFKILEFLISSGVMS
ncbi:MAG: peptidase [Nitrosopumilus sp. H13]|nr:MAG: peptidase [Nitrosopumilus sp. H13]